VIKIDGSYGEGGGQILRTSIALSCVTGKPVEVYNIRANRPKPGLAAQHLKGIEAAKIITNAEVEGLRLGSTKIVFKPKRLRGGKFRIDIGTAGSVTLILQTVLLPSILAEKESVIEITGGTDVAWSPPVDYFKNVTLKALRELGVKAEIELVKRGYYPKGGGFIRVYVEPSKLKGKEFKEIREKIIGISHCQNLPEHVAKRQANAAKEYLKQKGLNVEISIEVRRGLSTGSGITIWSGYKGGNALGEKGKRAEDVGREAAENFYKEYSRDGVFDYHLADQVMAFAAIAKDKTIYSTTEITLHQISNVYVIEKFLGKVIRINENNRVIEISGVGLT